MIWLLVYLSSFRSCHFPLGLCNPALQATYSLLRALYPLMFLDFCIYFSLHLEDASGTSMEEHILAGRNSMSECLVMTRKHLAQSGWQTGQGGFEAVGLHWHRSPWENLLNHKRLSPSAPAYWMAGLRVGPGVSISKRLPGAAAAANGVKESVVFDQRWRYQDRTSSRDVTFIGCSTIMDSLCTNYVSDSGNTKDKDNLISDLKRFFSLVGEAENRR